MPYVLAAIGAITVVALLWRAFGVSGVARVSAQVAPDDDPEFLRQLAERTAKKRDDGNTDGGHRDEK